MSDELKRHSEMRAETISAAESGACEEIGAVLSVSTGELGAIGAGAEERSLLRLPLAGSGFDIGAEAAALGIELTEGSDREEEDELLAAVRPGSEGAAGAVPESAITGAIVGWDGSS